MKSLNLTSVDADGVSLNFSVVILSLSLIQEEQLSDFGKRMRKIVLNCLMTKPAE